LNEMGDFHFGEGSVFSGLEYDCASTKSHCLPHAEENFRRSHTIALNCLICLAQPAIHALPHAVAGDFKEAAQVDRIADLRLTDRVRLRIEDL
jgi:hypothetical protein